MPLRGTSIPKLCLCSILFTASATLAQALPTTQPAAPAREGSVQQAMRYLYSVPRKSAGTVAQKSSMAGSTSKARRVQGVTSKPAVDDSDDRRLVQDIVGYPGSYYPENRSRLSDHEREYSNYRYFGGRPGRYGYGESDYYGNDDYSGDIYRFGFNRGYDRGQFDRGGNERTEANLQHFAGHLSNGLTLFNQGRYREASDAFRLAADTHQGDPSARIYAAHALFAVGRYQEAVGYLRRAFELQPRIVFLSYDLRDDYSKRSDFNQQLTALEEAVQRSPGNCDRLLLLGYIRYYSAQRDRAYAPLASVYKMNHRDTLAKRLMSNARPSDVVLESHK